MLATEEWAQSEFGAADLGDKRRTRRLVALAAEVAQAPAGTVTRACQSSASQEGAFRFLENSGIKWEPVQAAMTAATLGRSRREKRVHVPIDGTTLTLTDKARAKGFGAVGSWTQGSQGIQVMSAFAVGADGGVPLGIVSQRMWVRQERSRRLEKAPSSHVGQGETQYWLQVLRDAHEGFQKHAPDTEAFYQLDRGADCWPVLSLALELNVLLTVRAAHDRKLDPSGKRLWDEVRHTPVRDIRSIQVPARDRIRRRKRKCGKRYEWHVKRSARTAELEVKATAVALRLGNGQVAEYNAVLVRERRRRSDDRIEWMLLSTHPIKTKQDLRAIVDGYALRWRIEEFHRVWKRGLCHVEDTQLRSRQAVFKWATILASVASRAMHLTHLARQEPDSPAEDEFTPYELEALIALRRPKGIGLSYKPTLGQAVRWVADLGGYVGPWNGPPGATVIGRGLDRVLSAALAFENREKMR